MPHTTFIDATSSRLIGFDHVLAQLQPLSPYGRAAKQAMRPFLPGEEAALAALFDRQEQLLAACCSHPDICASLQHQLAQLPDWRDACVRLQAGAILTDTDLLALKQLLYWHAGIKRDLEKLSLAVDPALMSDYQSLQAYLDPDASGSPSFYLSDTFSPPLAEKRAQLRQVRRALQKLVQQQEQAITALTGQRFLLSGEIRIPKTAADLQERLAQLPPGTLVVSRTTYTDTYYRRQPTEQEQALASEIEALRTAVRIEEERVRQQLSAGILSKGNGLPDLFQALGQLDLLLARVRLSQSLNAIRPRVLPQSSLAIEFTDARHPVVAAELAEQGASFQPISWRGEAGAAVLTGANMGGKTVCLRLVGLLVAMAQHGLMVPAKSLSLTLFRGLRFISTAYSADTPGLSRFGSEVAALREILPLTLEPYLLLYDEIASGTNPVEGAALAQAIVECTADQPSLNLFATHHASLAQIPGVDHWQVIGLSQTDPDALTRAFAAGTVHWADLQRLMDYRLQPMPPGQALPQEALGIARLLGLPAPLIDRAVEIVSKHERA
ncbi:MAG: hypothetical protein GX060_03935 [Firmicutes bacterium]|nr:hypothetical protein [Bacillota bacterium]